MQLIADRRALHQIPELDRTLPLTTEYLRRALDGCRCRVFSPMPGALAAFFDFGKDSAIAFRADMDALPIAEKTGADYASRHPGNMHACGHDGHMAILLELGRRLSEKEALQHNVLLLFQPAEETTGGAKDLCATGILTQYRVKALFGLHLWPGLPAGEIFGRAGEMMARSCEVTVTIRGKSAHIAKADAGKDALAAGMAFYARAAELERTLPPDAFRLLKFGKFQAGTVRNALAETATLEGSLRAFQEAHFTFLQQGLLAIGAEIQAETGCYVNIHMNAGYPAVMNPRALFETVCACVPVAPLGTPAMTAEDFSWYQQAVPACFFFLGLGDVPPLHADNFDFDDRILQKGAGFFESLAENFL